MSGIEYVQIIAGQRHFQCANLHALLDTAACADRWKRAMKPDSERLVLCRRCPIGRQHHAEHHQHEAATPLQPVRAQLCIRCGRPSARMVGNVHCPSCWNREAEWRKGRNSRGNIPVAYIPPVPRRIGIVDENGAPAWLHFHGQHHQEAMALAVRAGFRLSDAQPGRSVWNSEAGRFEYHDGAGHTLLELEIDGRIEFVSVDRLHAGEEPAPVKMATQMLAPEEAALWLEISGEGESLGVDPHQLEFGCSRCRKGMLHAHKRHGQIAVECSEACC